MGPDIMNGRLQLTKSIMMFALSKGRHINKRQFGGTLKERLKHPHRGRAETSKPLKPSYFYIFHRNRNLKIQAHIISVGCCVLQSIFQCLCNVLSCQVKPVSMLSVPVCVHRMLRKKENTQVLPWWAVYEKAFPLLSKVAKYVLGIPASSAKSERVFSAGDIFPV